jgi:hypothetical protein
VRIALTLATLVLAGCSRFTIADTVTASAYRSAASPSTVRGYRVLAGDMHCHVRPPDPAWHVDRELPETLDLARAEGMDFVVLTPHVRARFFERPQERAFVEEEHAALRRRAQSLDESVLVVPGFEYTDADFGHATASFGDIVETLHDVPVDVAREHPERFFETFVARGGVLTINHPVLRPIGGPFEATRFDLSWRPFFDRGSHPPEIDAITRLAHGIEVFNLGVTHMRDTLLLGEEERSLRHASVLLDRMVRERGRPLAAVGGTDSHSHHLRAVTFVLARDRSIPALREAIVAGRTCVRDRAACTLEASADGERWVGVGESVSAPEGVLFVRAAGDDVTYFVNGVPQPGPRLSVSPCACTVVRARVGKGWSSAVRVNCDLVPPPTQSGSPATQSGSPPTRSESPPTRTRSHQ